MWPMLWLIVAACGAAVAISVELTSLARRRACERNVRAAEELIAAGRLAEAAPLLLRAEGAWRFANVRAHKEVQRLQRLRGIVTHLADASADRPDRQSLLLLEYVPTIDRLIALFGNPGNFRIDGRSMRREAAVELGRLTSDLKRIRKRVAEEST